MSYSSSETGSSHVVLPSPIITATWANHKSLVVPCQCLGLGLTITTSPGTSFVLVYLLLDSPATAIKIWGIECSANRCGIQAQNWHCWHQFVPLYLKLKTLSLKVFCVCIVIFTKARDTVFYFFFIFSSVNPFISLIYYFISTLYKLKIVISTRYLCI